MHRIENFAHTYSQAPWRKQLQIIGLFFAVLVFLALVAGIYLNVSARAATVGREIQDLQKTTEAINRDIEDLQSQLAVIQSSSEMEARAFEMGFLEMKSDEMLYLPVPGYQEKQLPNLAPYSERPLIGVPSKPPEYTESLFSWIIRKANGLSINFLEVEP